MNSILQIWGGSFYLANKVLFAMAERFGEERKRRFRVYGWTIYILGVPPWVYILISDHNWIAASVEAGGVPAMIFGLYNAYKHIDNPSPAADRATSCFTYVAILLGVGFSLWERGGLNSLSQVLEGGITIGFLMGSYLLAKKDSTGWLFFMLMNLSTAALMFIQDKPILCIQQLVSLCFVIYGFTAARRGKNA